MQDPIPLPHSNDSRVTTGEERRARERYPSSLELDCHPLGGERSDFWRAKVKDISAGGMGLFLRRRFEPRTVLVIGLENPELGFARTLLCRVVHATPQPNGTWYLGCAFFRELSGEDLQACGGDRIRPSEPDCRAWVRVTCNLDTHCREASEPATDRWPVKVVNVAPTGLALIVSRPITKGALLQVELPAAEGQAARAVYARVVQAQAGSAEEWLLGCEIAEHLSADELQQFPE
jgi:hypothetical protein